MNVLIVESPGKVKAINKYLGSDYKVLASFGHIRDLPSKDGSVKPDDDFAMTWDIDARAASKDQRLPRRGDDARPDAGGGAGLDESLEGYRGPRACSPLIDLPTNPEARTAEGESRPRERPAPEALGRADEHDRRRGPTRAGSPARARFSDRCARRFFPAAITYVPSKERLQSSQCSVLGLESSVADASPFAFKVE